MFSDFDLLFKIEINNNLPQKDETQILKLQFGFEYWKYKIEFNTGCSQRCTMRTIAHIIYYLTFWSKCFLFLVLHSWSLL